MRTYGWNVQADRYLFACYKEWFSNNHSEELISDDPDNSLFRLSSLV